MHRALLVDDIFQAICEHVARPDAVRLARVSRSFLEPCAAIIWRTFNPAAFLPLLAASVDEDPVSPLATLSNRQLKPTHPDSG